MTRRERKAVFDRLGSISGKKERLVLATGRYVGDGAKLAGPSYGQ